MAKAIGIFQTVEKVAKSVQTVIIFAIYSYSETLC